LSGQALCRLFETDAQIIDCHSDINGVLFALFNPVFVLSQLINTKKGKKKRKNENVKNIFFLIQRTIHETIFITSVQKMYNQAGRGFLSLV
jgi:hypothetical protein